MYRTRLLMEREATSWTLTCEAHILACYGLSTALPTMQAPNKKFKRSYGRSLTWQSQISKFRLHARHQTGWYDAEKRGLTDNRFKYSRFNAALKRAPLLLAVTMFAGVPVTSNIFSNASHTLRAVNELYRYADGYWWYESTMITA